MTPVHCDAAQAPCTDKVTKALQIGPQKSLLLLVTVTLAAMGRLGIERNCDNDAECRATTPRNSGDTSGAMYCRTHRLLLSRTRRRPDPSACLPQETTMAAPRHAGYARTLQLRPMFRKPPLYVLARTNDDLCSGRRACDSSFITKKGTFGSKKCTTSSTTFETPLLVKVCDGPSISAV